MPVAASLATILIISFVLGRLAHRFHFSKVIGLIFAGLILALPFIKPFVIGEAELLLPSLANWGLLALMFIAGFEVSGNLIYKEEKDAITITLSTVIISLLVGTVVMMYLGYSLVTSLIMGICFGITAEATKARVLLQLKKMNTRIGALMMGTGIVNDVIGIILFIFVIYFITHHITLSEVKILGGMILALTAGMIVHYKFDRFSKSVKFIERILIYAVIPFFFVNLGLEFANHADTINWLVVLVVFVTAAFSQLIGVFVTKPITHLSWKQLFLVGSAMNSKGAVELAIVFIALNLGLLPTSLYTALVITTLVSTIVFQIIIFKMVGNNPGIMD